MFHLGLLNEFQKFKFENNLSVSFSDRDFSNFVFKAQVIFRVVYSCAALGLNDRACCMRSSGSDGRTTARDTARHVMLNMDTNVPRPILTWWRCRMPEFPQCVMLAQKYLDNHHMTGTINCRLILK